MPQLRWILVPTWLHFGVVLGAKMGPSWVQMASKLKLKNDHQKDDLLNAFKIDFGPQLGGRRRSWGGAKAVPLGGEGGLLLLLGCLLGPRWPQDPSQD